MSARLKITLAQMNPAAGDIAGNADLARRALAEGERAGAALVMLPEMFLAGYQILDLSVRPAFLADCARALEALARETRPGGPALGIGAPMGGRGGVYNAFHILQDGVLRASVRKHHRPNYGVFDEKRLYLEGPISGPIEIGGCRMGFPICEDIWFPDVCETMAEAGAELLVSPNGSPYERGKHDVRVTHAVARTVETGLPLIYLNLMSGQDDQVFEGASFAINPGGRLALQMPVLEEAIETVELEEGPQGWRLLPGPLAHVPETVEQEYRCMMLGLSDYVRKSGFAKVLLGLSGGIDSALVAAIAADALGPANVRCVMLPSRFTSEHSLEDAAACAAALGVRHETLPIGGAVEAVGQGLAPFFAGLVPGIAEENIQSRLRGLYLMALSNKFGELLLTTGNKSEVAVGYSTLYGDMCGAYNPVKDLYKTRVFETCRWRNANHRPWMQAPAGAVIPARIITKPPTAELRENQKDEDSLPPYAVLDSILEHLIEMEHSVDEIVAAGHDRETVRKVQNLVYLSEYKRFQSAPGVKLSPRAFHLDRRYPVANKWRDLS